MAMTKQFAHSAWLLDKGEPQLVMGSRAETSTPQ